MSAVNTINLTIDDKAHSYARIYSALLSEEFQRKRAYASILSLFAFANIIEKESVNIQKSMTLFRNPILNEQYEIADLYVNNWHLDVRVVNDTDAVLVPKIHYESGIVPDFYVVVKIDKNLKNAELIGFVDTSKDVKEAFDYHYFKIPFTALINYDEFLAKIKIIKQEKHTQQDYELFQNSYLALMDGGLDLPTKNEVLKHLFKCSECRTEFCCFTGFEMVSCNISKYPDVLDDKTLDIIGAQSAYDEKYEGKEETIYIGEDENPAPIEQDSQQDGVDNILEELFNEEETEDSQPKTSENQNTTEPDMNIIESEDEISSTVDTDEDIEIIEEENNIVDLKTDEIDNGVELLSEDNNSNYNDMEIIGENSVERLEEESDFVVLNENENDVSELELEDEQPEIQEVQKVIVDYDENGVPIYSYITSVDQEKDLSVLSEAEPVEENTIKEDSEVENLSENQIDNDIQQDTVDNEDAQIETIPDNNDFIEADTSASLENIQTEDEDDIIQPAQEEHHEYFNVPLEQDKDGEELSSNDQTVGDESISDTIEQEDNQYSVDEQNQENEESEEVEDNEEYDEDEVYETYEGDDVKRPNKSPFILLSLLIALGLLGGGAFFASKVIKNKSNTASVPVETVVPPDGKTTNDMFEQPIEQENGLETPNNTDNTAENQENENAPQNMQDMFNTETQMPAQGTIPVPPPMVQQPQSNGDVNKVIANAFNQPTSGISLRGLNWFCTAELFSDPTFKNYLQNLDNLLKQNIKNNIMGIMQAPPNDSVAAKFAVDNNGNLQKVIISESSGSEQIDNIVLQSIKESFQGEKSQILNDSTLKSDMYYLKVVIKL